MREMEVKWLAQGPLKKQRWGLNPFLPEFKIFTQSFSHTRLLQWDARKFREWASLRQMKIWIETESLILMGGPYSFQITLPQDNCSQWGWNGGHRVYPLMSRSQCWAWFSWGLVLLSLGRARACRGEGSRFRETQHTTPVLGLTFQEAPLVHSYFQQLPCGGNKIESYVPLSASRIPMKSGKTKSHC